MSIEFICSDISKHIDVNQFTEEYITYLFNKYDIPKVVYCLKEFYDINIESIDNINSDNYTTQIIRNDKDYRNSVIAKYSGKCVICNSGECVPECCNVAHIWDFALCDTTEKYNPDNGLILCANIHLLFDSGLIMLEPNLNSTLSGIVSIRLHDKLKNSKYYKYNGQMITLSPENIPFIIKRNSIAKYNFS